MSTHIEIHVYGLHWNVRCDFASSQPLESFMVWDNAGKSVETGFYCVKIKCKLHRDSKNANMLRSFGPDCVLSTEEEDMQQAC